VYQPSSAPVLEHMTLQCRPNEVNKIYLNFLNHCYINTEVEIKEIYTSSHM